MKPSQNEILLIPSKPDSERDSIRIEWELMGGRVKQIERFWEKPELNGLRPVIYGPDTFSLVLAQLIGIDLASADDASLARLEHAWLKRKLEIKAIHQIHPSDFPVFAKPCQPKLFKAKIFENHQTFQNETSGLADETKVICSEILAIEAEARSFVLQNEILDIALYEGVADIESGRDFLNTFLANDPGLSSQSIVIDLGFNQHLGWFILEFNSAWGSGLNNCKPEKVLPAIKAASQSLPPKPQK